MSLWKRRWYINCTRWHQRATYLAVNVIFLSTDIFKLLRWYWLEWDAKLRADSRNLHVYIRRLNPTPRYVNISKTGIVKDWSPVPKDDSDPTTFTGTRFAGPRSLAWCMLYPFPEISSQSNSSELTTVGSESCDDSNASVIGRTNGKSISIFSCLVWVASSNTYSNLKGTQTRLTADLDKHHICIIIYDASILGWFGNL